jgi:hypothetical protein
MTKMNFAFVSILFGLGITSAYAANSKSFHVIEGVDKGCKVAKFSGGKWVANPEQDLNGQDITNVTPSKANAEFSNFKYLGNWYAAKSECIKDAEGGGSADSSSGSDGYVDSGSLPKSFIDLKLQKYLVMGSNTAASSTLIGGTTIASDAYKSGVGFSGRYGMHWKENKYFILDVASFSATQDNVWTGGSTTGAPQTSDSILKINVGMQMAFSKPLFGLKPYVAGSLGYAKLTGKITGPVTGGTLGVGYSASGFDLTVEGGLVKEFSPHWSGLFSLGFTYLSLSPKVDTTNLAQLYPLNSDMPKRGYSHLTAALGARYSF